MIENIVSSFEDLLEEMEKWPNAVLVFYGAAEEGRYIYDTLKKKNIMPSYFCDKSIDLIGTKYDGIPIISPSELNRSGQEKSFILVTTTAFHHESIKETLNSLKIGLTVFFPSCIKFDNTEIVVDTSTWLRQDEQRLSLINKNNGVYLRNKENYMQQVLFPPQTRIFNDLIIQQDFSNDYVNIINGKRITSFTHGRSYINRVHIFGDSRMLGLGIDDENTLNSTLQKLFNPSQDWSGYCVVNHSVLGCSLPNMINILKSEDISEDDIVIFTGGRYDMICDRDLIKDLQEDAFLFFSFLKEAQVYSESNKAKFLYVFLPRVFDVTDPSPYETKLQSLFWSPRFLRKEESNYDNERKTILEDLCIKCGVSFFNLVPFFQRPHIFDEVFLDTTHFGASGMLLIADAIIQFLSKYRQYFNRNTYSKVLSISDKIYQNERMEIVKSQLINDSSLAMFIEQLTQISSDKPDDAGVIIVNCNPFTKGHRYLISHAAKQVKHLYIFVLEEDKSYFSFDDRFEMVELGTKDLKNVSVLKSSRYIISSFTMPEYFDKDNLQDEKLDASLDIRIFTSYIAKALKVTKRFVGEEPFCKITSQYNDQMKKILPQFGIDLIVIPRFEIEGKAVSATDVRRCIKNNEIDKLKQLLPDTTLEYLIKKGMIAHQGAV